MTFKFLLEEFAPSVPHLSLVLLSEKDAEQGHFRCIFSILQYHHYTPKPGPAEDTFRLPVAYFLLHTQ